MTRKSAYILLAVAAAGLLLVTACGTSKKSQKGYLPAEATPEGGRNTIEGEFASLARSYADWTDVSVPVKLQVSQPKRLSVSATAKMIRGKALSISMRVFGIEVGSLYADNDSVTLIAKFNDMYCQESLAWFTQTYGLTLADMQAAILGQAFTPGSGRLDQSDLKMYKLELGENSISFTPKKLPKGLSWTFSAVLGSDAAPYLRTLTVNASGHNPIVCAYGTAQPSGAGMVAPWVNIGTRVGKYDIDATMTWEMSRAKWDTGLSINKPRIPSGCRRISAAKVLEILKK